MKTLKILLIGLYSILFSASLYAQNKIAVSVDGDASENAKNLAKETIISTINQSQYFRVATSNEDITLAAIVNKGTRNFEVLFKAIHKSKNFEKSYNASTQSGYDGFEDIVKNKVNQILTDLPRTDQVNIPIQQQPNDENLTTTHVITRNKYTPSANKNFDAFNFDLGLTLGGNNGIDAVAKWWIGRYFGLGIGAGLFSYTSYYYEYSYYSSYEEYYTDLAVPIFAHIELQIPQLIGDRWTPYLTIQLGSDIVSGFEYFYFGSGLGTKFKLNDRMSLFGGLSLKTIESAGFCLDFGITF